MVFTGLLIPVCEEDVMVPHSYVVRSTSRALSTTVILAALTALSVPVSTAAQTPDVNRPGFSGDSVM
jgi:hypothetical protein